MSRKALLLAAALVVALASVAQADDVVTHHEFQANCTITHHQPDDPIVFPNQPGASHEHTFMGNTTTNAAAPELAAGRGTGTTCLAPDDLSGVLVPHAVYNGDQPILPNLRRSSTTSPASTTTPRSAVPAGPAVRRRQHDGHPGRVPARARAPSRAGSAATASRTGTSRRTACDGTQLNIRYQAPSCWDGVHLDSADHKSHMAYPDRVTLTCPADHPVRCRCWSSRSRSRSAATCPRCTWPAARYSWHYDFFNAWDPPTLAALVKHCINGGLQCDPRGFDLYKPDRVPPGPGLPPAGPLVKVLMLGTDHSATWSSGMVRSQRRWSRACCFHTGRVLVRFEPESGARVAGRRERCHPAKGDQAPAASPDRPGAAADSRRGGDGGVRHLL